MHRDLCFVTIEPCPDLVLVRTVQQLMKLADRHGALKRVDLSPVRQHDPTCVPGQLPICDKVEDRVHTSEFSCHGLPQGGKVFEKYDSVGVFENPPFVTMVCGGVLRGFSDADAPIP